MWIYVISQHDMDSSLVHSAYIDEDEAKTTVESLNKTEVEKSRLYNEWVKNSYDDDEDCPDFGDYTYMYNQVWLT